MAPFWEQSPPIFRPLRSQNGAPAPRRLCACSSRCTPAAAQRTMWMPWQWRHCAQNLIRSGFGGIEKSRFPPRPGPCEQPGAQSSCRTSSSISWLPKDRQSSTRAVSRAYELLLRSHPKGRPARGRQAHPPGRLLDSPLEELKRLVLAVAPVVVLFLIRWCPRARQG